MFFILSCGQKSGVIGLLLFAVCCLVAVERARCERTVGFVGFLFSVFYGEYNGIIDGRHICLRIKNLISVQSDPSESIPIGSSQ